MTSDFTLADHVARIEKQLLTLRVSYPEAGALLDSVVKTAFDCGAWDRNNADGITYEEVYAASLRAKIALMQRIRELTVGAVQS